jgi:hypothetical protein
MKKKSFLSYATTLLILFAILVPVSAFPVHTYDAGQEETLDRNTGSAAMTLSGSASLAAPPGTLWSSSLDPSSSYRQWIPFDSSKDDFGRTTVEIRPEYYRKDNALVYDSAGGTDYRVTEGSGASVQVSDLLGPDIDYLSDFRIEVKDVRYKTKKTDFTIPCDPILTGEIEHINDKERLVDGIYTEDYFHPIWRDSDRTVHWLETKTASSSARSPIQMPEWHSADMDYNSVESFDFYITLDKDDEIGSFNVEFKIHNPRTEFGNRILRTLYDSGVSSNDPLLTSELTAKDECDAIVEHDGFPELRFEDLSTNDKAIGDWHTYSMNQFPGITSGYGDNNPPVLTFFPWASTCHTGLGLKPNYIYTHTRINEVKARFEFTTGTAELYNRFGDGDGDRDGYYQVNGGAEKYRLHTEERQNFDNAVGSGDILEFGANQGEHYDKIEYTIDKIYATEYRRETTTKCDALLWGEDDINTGSDAEWSFELSDFGASPSFHDDSPTDKQAYLDFDVEPLAGTWDSGWDYTAGIVYSYEVNIEEFTHATNISLGEGGAGEYGYGYGETGGCYPNMGEDNLAWRVDRLRFEPQYIEELYIGSSQTPVPLDTQNYTMESIGWEDIPRWTNEVDYSIEISNDGEQQPIEIVTDTDPPDVPDYYRQAGTFQDVEPKTFWVRCEEDENEIEHAYFLYLEDAGWDPDEAGRKELSYIGPRWEWDYSYADIYPGTYERCWYALQDKAGNYKTTDPFEMTVEATPVDISGVEIDGVPIDDYYGFEGGAEDPPALTFELGHPGADDDLSDGDEMYWVSIDGVQKASGNWEDGQTVEVPLDDYKEELGLHEIEIAAEDYFGISSESLGSFNVYRGPWFGSEPENRTYAYRHGEFTLEWQAKDGALGESSGLSNYTIYRDGSAVESGDLNGSISGKIAYEGDTKDLSLGGHTYRLLVEDWENNYNESVVSVEIFADSEPVVSVSCPDYEFNSTGNELSIVISLNGTGSEPGVLRVYVDGNLTAEFGEEEWQFNETKVIGVDGYGIGAHSYYVFANRSDPLQVVSNESGSFWVYRTPSFAEEPDDVSYVDLYGSFDLSWLAEDDGLDNYTLYRDEEMILNGSFDDPSGGWINWSGDTGELPPGESTYNLTVVDGDGLTAASSITVGVVPYEAPSISIGGLEEGEVITETSVRDFSVEVSSLEELDISQVSWNLTRTSGATSWSPLDRVNETTWEGEFDPSSHRYGDYTLLARARDQYRTANASLSLRLELVLTYNLEGKDVSYSGHNISVSYESPEGLVPASALIEHDPVINERDFELVLPTEFQDAENYKILWDTSTIHPENSGELPSEYTLWHTDGYRSTNEIYFEIEKPTLEGSHLGVEELPGGVYEETFAVSSRHRFTNVTVRNDFGLNLSSYGSFRVELKMLDGEGNWTDVDLQVEQVQGQLVYEFVIEGISAGSQMQYKLVLTPEGGEDPPFDAGNSMLGLLVGGGLSAVISIAFLLLSTEFGATFPEGGAQFASFVSSHKKGLAVALGAGVAITVAGALIGGFLI